MEVQYTNYTNVDARYVDVYEPGNRLVKGYSGTIEVDDPTNLHRIAELLFHKHNRDDRPDGRLCPSMSVGDVIVVGETAVSVASMGWQNVHLDPADIITDRTWSEVTKSL